MKSYTFLLNSAKNMKHLFVQYNPPFSQAVSVIRLTMMISVRVAWCLDFRDGSAVKNMPANAGDVASIPNLRRSDPLENEMATHSCILAWEIPWAENPGGLQSMGPKESDTT